VAILKRAGHKVACYRKKVEDVLAMDETERDRTSASPRERDREAAGQLPEEGLSHDTVKCQGVMGVMSDCFLHDTWLESVGHGRHDLLPYP
jgi:hypothetical protein